MKKIAVKVVGIWAVCVSGYERGQMYIVCSTVAFAGLWTPHPGFVNVVIKQVLFQRRRGGDM